MVSDSQAAYPLWLAGSLSDWSNDPSGAALQTTLFHVFYSYLV